MPHTAGAIKSEPQTLFFFSVGCSFNYYFIRSLDFVAVQCPYFFFCWLRLWTACLVQGGWPHTEVKKNYFISTFLTRHLKYQPCHRSLRENFTKSQRSTLQGYVSHASKWPSHWKRDKTKNHSFSKCWVAQATNVCLPGMKFSLRTSHPDLWTVLNTTSLLWPHPAALFFSHSSWFQKDKKTFPREMLPWVLPTLLERRTWRHGL